MATGRATDGPQIGVAVIGAGSRGRGVVKNLLRDGQRVVVRSVFDPDPAQAQAAVDAWQSPDTRICSGYREAIDTAAVDWVMVFSPNAFHREHILAGFAAGNHVFSEKPLATTIDDCQAIYTAHQACGLTFATGFVLRYAPIYRRVRELIDTGAIGKLLSIDANENIAPAHGAYIMKNWRRRTKLSGPHILEKCCHDLDLINWFAGSVPTKAAAFGSLDFFVPENHYLEDKYRNAAGESPFDGWRDPHGAASAFTSDKDLMDNLVAILTYRNGIKVQFQATMSNAIPERRMYIAGTEGTIIAELYSGTLKSKRLADDKVTEHTLVGDGHGGGDDYIMKELYDTMVHSTPPKSSGNEGLVSAVTALAIDQAAAEGRVVDLEPIWKALGRDV